MLKEKLLQITPGGFIRFMARPYVAGYSLEAGVETAIALLKRNRLATIDVLGEEAQNDEDGLRSQALYIRLLDTIAANEAFNDPALRPTVSLKLSSLIAASIEGEELILDETALRERVLRILTRAREHSIEITIDMEDYHWTDVTLRLYTDFFHGGFNSLGTVLQSRLFRTESDLRALPDGSRVRLCIGIYKEDASRALTDKRQMKERLLKLSRIMLEKQIFLELATHDAHYIQRFFREVLPDFPFPEGRLELQMLLGVPRNHIQEAVYRGKYTDSRPIPVRLYVPFAESRQDATHYCRRRLINNPDIMTHGLKNLVIRKNSGPK